jgi:hypothetical protein
MQAQSNTCIGRVSEAPRHRTRWRISRRISTVVPIRSASSHRSTGRKCRVEFVHERPWVSSPKLKLATDAQMKSRYTFPVEEVLSEDITQHPSPPAHAMLCMMPGSWFITQYDMGAGTLRVPVSASSLSQCGTPSGAVQSPSYC